MSSSKTRDIQYRELTSIDGENSCTPSTHSHRYGLRMHFCAVFMALGWALTLGLYWHSTTAAMPPSTPIPASIFRPITKVFQHDVYWSGMSVETQKHWSAQFAGNGALWIEDPEKYGLTNGIVAEFDHPHKKEMTDARFFIVSKIHEVHCLSWIRMHWWYALQGTNMTELGDGGVLDVHVDHCFEYLRQAISCGGGNIVLEGYNPLIKDETVATSVSGWGGVHQCIDFDALSEFQIQQEAKYNLTWLHRGE